LKARNGHESPSLRRQCCQKVKRRPGIASALWRASNYKVVDSRPKASREGPFKPNPTQSCHDGFAGRIPFFGVLFVLVRERGGPQFATNPPGDVGQYLNLLPNWGSYLSDRGGNPRRDYTVGRSGSLRPLISYANLRTRSRMSSALATFKRRALTARRIFPRHVNFNPVSPGQRWDSNLRSLLYCSASPSEGKNHGPRAILAAASG